MTNSAPSHLLPVFARVDLGFERGEGAWLIATNGERYLDFTSGVAVNALGHCASASGRGACRSRRPSSGTCRTCSGARTATSSPHGCASRALPISCSSVIPAPKRWNARSRSRAAITPPRAIPSAIASSPSRARSTAARWARWPRPARPNISKASVRRWTASTRSPHGDLEAVKKAIGPQTAAILIEPVQGEGGVRSAPHAFFKALRQLCDDKGLLLIFDEVQTGMGRTGDLFAYKRLGVTPDIMSLAPARRRFSDRRLSRHGRGGVRHDAGVCTARPSAATRWRSPPPTRCST